MILEIRLKNFFSIDKEIVLDMKAESIRSQKVKNLLQDNCFSFKDEKILKTVALYGANASGKSNIINAIRFCCSMIFKSHHHNENSIFNFQTFKFSDNKEACFFISFVCEEIQYDYSFSLTREKISKESLFYYPNKRKVKIFTRDENFGKEKKEKYNFGKEIKKPFDVAESTSQKCLYISRASQMDRIIGKKIFNFFNERFILKYLSLNQEDIKEYLDKDKEFLLQCLKMIDSDITDISYELKERDIICYPNIEFNKDSITIDKQGSITKEQENYIQINTYHHGKKFNFDIEESQGTKKMFYTILRLIDILRKGKAILIDELETSLHSDLVEFILKLFHCSESAQLIFSTHNTNLLDLNKLRRDQIYFINKTQGGAADLYSLYDYKDFRENMDLEKAYLQGRFDAIPIINDNKQEIKKLLYGETE